MAGSVDGRLLRLAFWADIMMSIKNAGMSWPGFSYTDAEWARLGPLAEVVAPFDAGRFKVVNAIVFIALAAVAMGGGFLPLASALFPVPAETPVLPFVTLLAATCFLVIGLGLPVSMRIAAPLSAGAETRARLGAISYDGELWSKVAFQMRRIILILCGFLVPGVLLFIAYNIDGGPIISVLKWVSWAALLLSAGDSVRRRKAARQSRNRRRDARFQSTLTVSAPLRYPGISGQIAPGNGHDRRTQPRLPPG